MTQRIRWSNHDEAGYPVEATFRPFKDDRIACGTCEELLPCYCVECLLVPVDGSGLDIGAAAEAIPQHSFDPSSKGQRMTIAIAVVFAALGIQEEHDV